MNPSTVYCLNPACLQENKLTATVTNKLQCQHCNQQSLKLGNIFYATRPLSTDLQQNTSVKRISFLARKNAEENDNYCIKLICNRMPNILGGILNNSLPEFASPISNILELNPDLRRIKERNPEPDHIPIVEEIFQNEFCVYIVSRYIKGQNLQQKIAVHGLSSDYILKVFKKIAEALKKIHDRGFVHGDIKPKNIVFSSNDDDKIFFVDPVAAKDFGAYKYVPQNKTAYVPPELLTHVDRTSQYPYREDYGKSHDLYAISAVFVKVLSNTFHDDYCVRDGNNKWDWTSSIKGVDTLKLELDRLVAWEAGFRNMQSVAILIQCIEQLSPQSTTSQSNTGEQTPIKTNNCLSRYIGFTTYIPVLTWLGVYYNNLNESDKQKFSTKLLMITVPVITVIGGPSVIFGGIWWLATNVIFSPPKPENNNISENSRISQGEKILIKQEHQDPQFLDLKEQGKNYFKEKEYPKALESFNNALDRRKNSPETLIYSNNAEIADKPAYSIAVIVRSEKPQDSLKILRGVAQAQDEINSRGGINTKRLKIVIVNDDNDKEIAKKMANAIADRNDILGVIGHYSSDCTIAAAQVYNERQLVAISATSTSDKISHFKPYVFRTVPNDSDAGKILADYTANKWKNVAVVFDSDNEYSKSLKSAFIKNVQRQWVNVVGEIDISEESKYLEDRIQKLSDRSQVLMLALPDSRLLAFSQIATANRKKMQLLGGDDLYKKEILENIQNLEAKTEYSVGMVLAVPWAIDKNRGKPFVKKSSELWNADVDWQTAMAYDATQALIHAIGKETKPTRETVKNALRDPNFKVIEGANETIEFNGSDRNANDRLVQIKKSKENRSDTGYDFVEINP
ncbi:ABC transporter substrate-binding protein [Chamaesiphon sp. OTE_75_metabat_556]|uniref:ABC transporter substrate-binding protein n=1 Tax=Chamaesiphon sp. OTE_75_metabat_556 TaxID=2964692 RepID=UPI00286C8BD9|nr:ABC transporter substrate-binding protein [Chamaesiphon sp. OTE_75_metabat_556]